ncbi:MAG: protein kinase, partial [Myxococcales bacterium]|nr:protein kinase [Myxococcales bacterium]
MGDISSDGLSGGMFPDDEDSEIRVRRPQLFGDYELVRRLRVGGMAELYRARREVHKNEQVVIKRLLLSLTDEAEYVSMFLDEAQLAIRLEHPNIVRTFDVGQVDDTPFMAMELIDGQDLSTVIRRARELGRTVPVSVACHIATCVAGALSYAHELTDERGRALGVIHRDLSPHNILVSFGGSVKLIDFGVAKSTAQTMKTRAGMFKGKHGYLSPEQATGAALDARSDVFSLGICLYEMITGERLFAGSSDFSTLQRVRAAQIPDLRGERPDVPEALVEIVDKALARAPEERFESAQAFADALDGFMHSLVADDGEQELVAFLGELFAKEIAGGVDAEEGEEVDLSTGLSGFDDLEPVSVVSEFDVLPDDGLAVLEDAQAPSPVRPPPPPPPGAARAHAPLPPPPSTSGELPAPIVGGGATAGLGGLTPDGAPTPGGASGETDAEAQPLGDLAGGAGDPPESAASDFRTLDDEPETFEPLDQEVVDAEFVDVESSELGDVEAASATDLGAEQASSPDAQLEARADGLGTGDAKPGAGVLPGEAPDGDLDGGDYSDESVRRDSHDDVAGATPGFARDHSAAQGPDCQPVDEPDLLAESVGHGVRAHGSPSSSDEALFEAASLDEAFEAAFEEAVSQDAPPEDAPPDVAALEGALPPEPAGGSPHEGVSQATSPDAAARGGRGSETASGASQEASL